MERGPRTVVVTDSNGDAEEFEVELIDFGGTVQRPGERPLEIRVVPAGEAR